jgi:hypothetical protein
MNLQKAEQAILNTIYAAMAWLLLDLGFLLQEHGKQSFSILLTRPEMAVGGIIVIACIVGLIYKSRLAAIILFLFFLLPLVLRLVQGGIPSTMMLVFFLMLLYFFLTGVLAVFRYHHLQKLEQDEAESIDS